MTDKQFTCGDCDHHFSLGEADHEADVSMDRYDFDGDDRVNVELSATVALLCPECGEQVAELDGGMEAQVEMSEAV